MGMRYVPVWRQESGVMRMRYLTVSGGLEGLYPGAVPPPEGEGWGRAGHDGTRWGVSRCPLGDAGAVRGVWGRDWSVAFGDGAGRRAVLEYC